jgi:hypothetical protein
MRRDEVDMATSNRNMSDHIRDYRQPTLLLYLFDELSPAERAEVKRLIAEDASLQNDLESLRAIHGQVAGGLEELDAAMPLVTSADQSVRRVMREMRHHQLEIEIRPVAQLEGKLAKDWPRWVYGVISAAALIFIALSMWGMDFFDFTPAMPGPRADQHQVYDAPDYYADREKLEDILFASFGGGEEIDHPLELEETEDPAAFDSADKASS